MENEVLETTEKVEVIEIKDEVEEVKEEKPYTLRKLRGEDTFKVLALFKKIGLRRFTSLLQNDAVKSVITKIKNGESKEIGDEQLFTVGAIVFEIGDVLIDGLTGCEKEVFTILDSVSNLTENDIKALDMDVFLSMIIDVVLENKDFFKAVSKRFK